MAGSTARENGTGTTSEAPAIVLVHGLGDDESAFEQITPLLRELGDPVVLPLPGFGGVRYEQNLSFEDQVVALADRHLAGRTILGWIGHSMGGAIAVRLSLAAKGGAAVVVDVDGNLVPEDMFLSQYIIDRGPDAFRDLVKSKPTIPTRYLEALAKASNEALLCASQWLKVGNEKPFRDELCRLGDRAAYITSASTPKTVKPFLEQNHITSAESKAGHWLCEEDSKLVVDVFRKLLARSGTAASGAARP